MPNTIAVIEGWDSAESWKSVALAIPSGGYNTSSAGYSGTGKCLGMVTNNLYSIPYQVLAGSPTLGTTWFIVSMMVKFGSGTTGGGGPCISFGNASPASGISSSSCRMGFGCTDKGEVFIRSSSAGDILVPSATLPSNQWLHLEYRHRYGNGTTGNWEIYINGNLLWSGVGDNSGVTNPRYVVLSGMVSSGGSAYVYFDDMVVAYSSDPTPSLIGRCEVRDYAPTSTAVNGWAGSDGNSVDNHLLVNSGLAASATNVQASAGSGLFDLYGHAAAPAAPVAVQVKAAASASTLGVDDYSIVLRSGAQTAAKRRTIGNGAAQWMLSDLIATDPNTGSAWTKGGFDASTFGVKA